MLKKVYRITFDNVRYVAYSWPIQPICDGISRVCCGKTLASIQPFVIDEFITDWFPSVVRVHLIIIYFLC